MPNNENNEYLDQVQLDKIYDIHDARIKIGSLLPEEVEGKEGDIYFYIDLEHPYSPAE